jgi:hypothetical protein
VPNLQSIKEQRKGLFALFQGFSGAAKSTAALSFPKPYIFDFDRKMPNVALRHYPNSDINWDTFEDIFEVSRKLEEFQNHCPYETLIVDSVTSLANLCLLSVGKTKGESTMAMLEKLKGKAVEMMSIDYYNAETAFFQRYLLDLLKSLWNREGNPKYVITIAHILQSESAPDLKTKRVTVSKSILTAGRKVAAYIPTVFDDVFTFGLNVDPSDGSSTRVLFTKPQGDCESRTSLNLPDIVELGNGDLYRILQRKGCL